jgi:hypothetical protein
VKEDLQKTGLAFIWKNQSENYNNAVCRVVKRRHYDNGKHDLFSGLSQKISLFFIEA